MTAPAPDWGAQLRALTEAAAGLLGTFTAARAADGSDPATDVGPADRAAPADHAAECRSCPVCTALAVLRGRRPDLSEALADVLATASTALRAHARPAGDEPAPAEEQAPPPPPPAPVQHIEVA